MMINPNDPHILKLNHAYDLDSGGYTFEEPPEGLKGLACFVWDDPDPDYIPWVVGDDNPSAWHAFHGLSCPIYTFAPNSGHFALTEWPQEFQDGEDTFTLVRHGHLHETEHECNCHGKLVPWTGAAGEPDEPIPPGKLIIWCSKGKADLNVPDRNPNGMLFWEFTGTPSDNPHPECHRCEGTGHVPSPGGEWAVYCVRE